MEKDSSSMTSIAEASVANGGIDNEGLDGTKTCVYIAKSKMWVVIE